MNRVPEALAKIVRSDRHLAVHPDRSVVLRENDPGATLKRLNVGCLGCDHLFAFTLDYRNPQNHPVPLTEHTSKTPSSKWNKVCDGIFVWHVMGETQWRVLVCDLKSAKQHGSDWMDQLRSSACFVEYLFVVLRRFYPDLPHAASVRYHAITFYGIPKVAGHSKRRTGLRQDSVQSPRTLENPDQVPVVNDEHVFLRRLCA